MPRTSNRRFWLLLALLGLLAAPLSPASAAEGDFWTPNLLGTTGLINTPTAYVLPEGTILFGVSVTERKWAYYVRGASDNYNYGFTVGLVPRVEITFRVTYVPDAAIFKDFAPGIADRGGGGRLTVLNEGRLAPALSLGIDDARGTKRFHSLYAVSTKEVSVSPDAAVRVTLGYGSDVLEDRHPVLLNGYFGGAELILFRTVSLAVDNDTEKWNVGLRASVLGRLMVSYAFLDFDIPSGNVAWFQRF